MTPEQKRLYELKAEVFAAAGHPIRLAILELLAGGERCVCEIAEAVDAERSNVSRHLSVLARAGVATCRKDGLKVMYALATPCILNFMQCVDGVLRRRATEAADVLEAL